MVLTLLVKSAFASMLVSCPELHSAPHSMPSLGRRELLGSGVLFALALSPRPASASYALYKAAGDTMAERKASGDWKPGSDRETLASIQAGIERKRPTNPNKVRKAPQYCAGQTSGVQPMLENICSNIGISKADQSNTMADTFGNMVIGVESEEYKRYKAASERAADNQRLRELTNK